jgi:DNA (cytosine-5)-methyltransferase 1
MIDVYDFFSGCGGASEGFKQAGCNIVLGLDNNTDAAATYRNNFPESVFIHQNIKRFHEQEIAQYMRTNNYKLFCGCAPCQPFSQQNKKKNKDDDRAILLNEFLRFVKYYLPDFIFIENVPGIQAFSVNNGLIKDFCETLKELNYSYKCSIISAADYGIPQLRKRFILIASKNNTINFPKPTHGNNIKPYSIVSDWLYGFSVLQAGETDILDPDHCTAKLSPLNLERIKATPEGGDRTAWESTLKLNCHKNYTGHTDVYGRMSFNKISATLTTRCISYSNGRYGHPTENRAISIREAACLQTFPRIFKFKGSINSKARQIGNAVPPLLAYHFGINFMSLT